MSGTRIYIGRLSNRASERDVEHFFRGYGKIRDIVIKNGFGFAEFDSFRDAEDAVYDLNGKDLAGDRVVLEFSRRERGMGQGGYGGRGGHGGGRDTRYGPPTQTRHRMIVENLSTRVSWQDLKDMMRREGCDVTYADAHRNVKNEGVICFASRSDLERALDRLQGEDVNGRRLKLIDDSERGRSRSRSRDRRRHTRSRSRSRSDSRGSRSKSRSRSRSRSRTRTPSASPRRSKSRSRSASGSPRSPAKSRSVSVEKREKSRSRSPSRSP